MKYSNFHSLWFKAITQSALIKVALVHSSQRSDKFSVSHCGICISQCEICIPQCGFYISQCETENLPWSFSFYARAYRRILTAESWLLFLVFVYTRLTIVKKSYSRCLIFRHLFFYVNLICVDNQMFKLLAWTLYRNWWKWKSEM